ncbi:MAG: UDP-N-acetylmuramoyl-tripeptide--D-alanyl-D-alanine ligase, partial [Firmicutes bacterium]|nr:UDP-N-acetylmuramoyl-tripeptide--D-alanyl-D-alanine ligase [Bacillota bacterium]
MPQFTLEEIIKATNGQLLTAGSHRQITGVSIDSRRLVPGDVFFALKGPNFNGHDFAAAAAEKGAAAIVCSRAPELHAAWRGAVIKVPDTLLAYGDLARFHRQRYAIPVIGITGSNGKTTTKELVAAVLSVRYKVVKTEKNFNNEIGLPQTLFQIDETTEAVVVEMGMRGAGQIAYLTRLAQPTVGIITNIGVTHLELLGTREAIAAAKGELIAGLPPSGLAVLNGDDPLVTPMAALFPGESLFYSLRKPDGQAKIVPALYMVAAATKGEQEVVTADGRWGEFEFTLPLLGRHNIANALAALTAGLSLGLTTDEAVRGLQGVNPVENRLRKIDAGGIMVLDDTYNASPPSVQAALEVLRNLDNPGRKIAVLGDMLELGPLAREAHQQIGELTAAYGCVALFAYGPLSAATVEGAAQKG